MHSKSVIDYVQYHNQNNTLDNLIINTYKNKVLKYNSLVIKEYKIINSISDKIKVNKTLMYLQ